MILKDLRRKIQDPQDLSIWSAKDPDDPQRSWQENWGSSRSWQDHLRIFEDPQGSWPKKIEDPWRSSEILVRYAKDRWRSLKILKDLGKNQQRILKDPWGSSISLPGSLKILKDLGKIHKGPLKIFGKNIKDLQRSW